MKDEATRAFDACEAVAETLSERGIEASQDDVAAVTEAALGAFKGREGIPDTGDAASDTERGF